MLMFRFFNRDAGRSKYDPEKLKNTEAPAPIEGVEAYENQPTVKDETQEVGQDDVDTEKPAPERVYRPSISGTENAEEPLPLDPGQTRDEVMSAYENADTLTRTKTASIATAEGGTRAAEIMGEKRSETLDQQTTSLGEEEEAKRSIDLMRAKYAKKLATSTPEIAFMSLEAELEETEDALASAEADNQESVARELRDKLSALQRTKTWLQSDGDKKVA